ncbi:MAG: DUF115 domain-containing protein [Treponema sp.]|nr:DUF115 domain-containing protein [Treponema sp.]
MLHSRYNPHAEAVRYIDSLNLNDSTECFILIEPGLGYIIPVLKEKFKNSKIIALHVPDAVLHCDAHEIPALLGHDITGFLEKEVPQTDIEKIRVIEWRPSLNYYRETYVNLLAKTVEFLKRMDAEHRTTSAFGKRWLRNFFNNLNNVKKIVLYRQTNLPVIVTGAGPGLEQALPLIAKMQDSCLIIAASSSILALSSYGITADIVIATDGGAWALRHIYPLYRHIARQYDFASQSIIAANLCAALPSQTKDTPFLLINDGSFWQSIIFNKLTFPSVIIPQKGTVSASALELAMQLSSGGIYLAGLDFSFSGIRTHVKPYAFDSLLFSSAIRFNPVYSGSFSRFRLLKEGGSMNIYAAWFKEHIENRVYSLTDHAFFKKGSPQNVTKKKNGIFNIIDAKPAQGLDILLSAVNNPEYAENIKQELLPLLFSNKKNITVQELKTALCEAVNE